MAQNTVRSLVVAAGIGWTALLLLINHLDLVAWCLGIGPATAVVLWVTRDERA